MGRESPTALAAPRAVHSSGRPANMAWQTSACPAGLACDPATGEPIPCTPGYVAPPSRVYRRAGRLARCVLHALWRQVACMWRRDTASPPHATGMCRGRTAKEVAVAILEPGALGAAWDGSAARAAVPVTRLEHAAYLGRELQRAELALATGGEYIQD